MCLKFAKQCLKINKMKHFFERNDSKHLMEKRSSNANKVVRAQTERFRKSAIPSMVKMLNASESKKRKLFRKGFRNKIKKKYGIFHSFFTPPPLRGGKVWNLFMIFF